ncbi:hypothetical protein BDN67DRAFT_978122 [Paxillus ammoniavirescens]|nr:hypothetical protein BDN67DRAFT_978122 [Paxillus ammoniavirescens]
MPWSEAVTERLSLVDRFTTEESDWHRPFNTLPFELFPPSAHHQITPQYKPVKGSQDFTVHYIIRKRRVPIFFVELKTYGTLKNLCIRALAEDQMRDSFREFLSGSIPTPKLIGISSFGTQFCVYTSPPRHGPLSRTSLRRMPASSTTSRRRTNRLSMF